VAEPKLSAVITCYKDEPAVPVMHARLTAVFRALGVEYEIIFVNDASPDGAGAALNTLAAADEHVLVVEHARNFGSQNAFVSGMQIADGDAVILLDGDLQDPPELISEFYALWRQGNDVVYGRRGQREGSWLLALFCRLFYKVFRSLAEVPMPLDAGDFALMDRKVVGHLLAFPEADQFLRGLRAYIGFKQVGVDYLRPARPFGRSTHSWLKNFWWAKKAIFSFSFAPIEVMGYVAAALTALSFLAAVYQVVQVLQHPGAPLGAASVLVAVALFGSLNLLALSIIGEYLSKVFDESKRRPKFVRKSIRHGGELLLESSQMEDFIQRRAQEASRRRARSGAHDG